MSDFKYYDFDSEAPKLIEPTIEEVVEEPILEEVVEEPKSKKKIKKEEPVAEKAKDEKVALFSTRSIFWEGIGQIKRGYNIVTKEQADHWVKRNHIRVATPEEILKELNG